MRPLNHLQSKLIVRRPCNVCAMKTTSSPPTGNGSKGNVIKRHASHRIRIKSNDPIAILQIDYPKFTLFLHAFLFFSVCESYHPKSVWFYSQQQIVRVVWFCSLIRWLWMNRNIFFFYRSKLIWKKFWRGTSSLFDRFLKFWKCQMPTIFPSRMYFRMMIITKTIPRAIIKCGASFRNR